LSSHPAPNVYRMKSWRRVLKYLLIAWISLLVLVIGLAGIFYYLLLQPHTTREISRADNVTYRVIGAEFYRGSNVSLCSRSANVYFYIRRYKKGDLHRVAIVLNEFEIHERTTRYSPALQHLDSLMFCQSFTISICSKNVVKYYDCGDRFSVEMIRYKRINEDQFCLIPDSGKKECFDFKWKPK